MHKILDVSTKPGRWFLIVTQIFILISLVAFSLSTLPNLSTNQSEILQTIESIILFIFILEYALRVILSNKKFIFSFYGVIDFLSIVPSFFFGADTQTLRVLRILRVFEVFRYNKAINRLSDAITHNKDELILFFSASVVVIYLAAAGIYVLENPVQPDIFRSIFDALWWAVVTLTTVGYGDIYPITAGGKILTYVILMVGLGVVAIPTALIASALSKNNN